jgi:hypothetical protein
MGNADEPSCADGNQMSFGQEALFEKRLELFPVDPPSVGALLSSPAEVKAVIESLIKQRDEYKAQIHRVWGREGRPQAPLVF